MFYPFNFLTFSQEVPYAKNPQNVQTYLLTERYRSEIARSGMEIYDFECSLKEFPIFLSPCFPACQTMRGKRIVQG